MEKRRKPETACTDCGAPGSNLALAEDYGNCWRPGCKGSIQRAIGENDWAECPSCAATGWESGKVCSQCDGAGWLFVRRHYCSLLNSPGSDVVFVTMLAPLAKANS
jgi:translation initiation factor 2 gamma subunit (eIF-2gamma)